MRENTQNIKEIDSSESKNENTLILQNEIKNKICNIKKMIQNQKESIKIVSTMKNKIIQIH